MATHAQGRKREPIVARPMSAIRRERPCREAPFYAGATAFARRSRTRTAFPCERGRLPGADTTRSAKGVDEDLDRRVTSRS